MTDFDLGLLPSGHLYCFPSAATQTSETTSATIKTTFAQDTSAGLFHLAARKSDADLNASLQYWRNFACKYLSERCLMEQSNPLQPDPIEPFTSADTMPLLLSLPPMPGAEYATANVLQDIRCSLDNWVCEQIRILGGLDVLLAKKAPQWHQVGRVCFHLAENKNDPDYPFAFMATYAPELTKQGRIRHQPLGRALQEYAGAKNKKALIRLLSPVHLAAKSSAIIKELVDTGDIYHPLAWTPDEAYGFLQHATHYEQARVIVRLPDWWKKRSRIRANVTIGEKGNNFNTEALLDFELHIALGDEKLTRAELNQLKNTANGLVFMKGQWVEINQQRLDEALTHWKMVETEAASGGLSFAEGMRLLAGAPINLKDDSLNESREWLFVQPGKWLTNQLQALRSPEQVAAINPGAMLKATLRPYQQTGVNWLWLLSQLGIGACLADDMGLGKTMQVISLLLALKKRHYQKPSLLLLPASLIGNWKAELERFAPSLRCQFIHSSHMHKKAINEMASDNATLQAFDLVITTYGTLMRQPWLQEHTWQLVILDEAQAIKNPSARQTKAVKTLNASARIALTGTPVENRLSDLWSLFDFLNPGLLGSASRFKSFVKTLSARSTDQYAPLRNLVSPYILRRLKTDRTIISDLPEKTEVSAYCGLSKAQALQYQLAVKQMTHAIENIDGIKRRGLVLSYLLRFKQICNHPAQWLGNDEYDPKQSGKFQRLENLCEEIVARQEKLLLFTQFREMTAPLADFLTQQFAQPGLVLHGGTAVKQRQKMVESFQQENGPPFFVLSLKAGGTGLNLTQASHVIHFDRWWNPAVENQATDRAFRIGQKRNVLVHKFICQGTIEEKIDTLIKEKTDLASNLLEGGAETLLTEMGDKELLQLVTLDIDKTKV